MRNNFYATLILPAAPAAPYLPPPLSVMLPIVIFRTVTILTKLRIRYPSNELHLLAMSGCHMIDSPRRRSLDRPQIPATQTINISMIGTLATPVMTVVAA